MKSVCFSGHRAKKLPWGEDEQSAGCRALKLRLMAAAYASVCEGYTHFITGMAPGVDMYAAEAVLKLREGCDITLECALPFHGHAQGWNTALRARHDEILSRADAVTVLAQSYTRGCMTARNRYMVLNAQRLIAVYGGGRGGTANTLSYAHKLGLDIMLIDPNNLEE